MYRLEQEFNRQGLTLSRQTMANWLLWLYRTSGCAKQAIVLYEYQRTPSVSCKASQAGCTRTDTRDTTDCLGTSVWWAAGRMQGENLTRH